MDTLAGHLAANVKQLRAARGFTQQQMARLSGLPRATWANLESGSANPTLAVLHRVAAALQISLEELLAAPRAASRFYARSAVPVRLRGQVSVRQLLPDPIPGSGRRLPIPAHHHPLVGGVAVALDLAEADPLVGAQRAGIPDRDLGDHQLVRSAQVLAMPLVERVEDAAAAPGLVHADLPHHV